MIPKFISSAFYKLVDLILEFIPKSFHEFFTVVGVLVILIGFIYNLLEDKIFVGKGDPLIMVGFFLIELGIISYLIKVTISLLPKKLLKHHLFLSSSQFNRPVRNLTILRAFIGFLYCQINSHFRSQSGKNRNRSRYKQI